MARRRGGRIDQRQRLDTDIALVHGLAPLFLDRLLPEAQAVAIIAAITSPRGAAGSDAKPPLRRAAKYVSADIDARCYFFGGGFGPSRGGSEMR